MKPQVLVAAGLTAILAANVAQAQQENATGAAKLDPIATVDDVQHSVWASGQTLNAISFMLQYGDTTRLRQVLYPNYENGLTPGYVFTPLKIEKGKKYPGLVILHGSNHGSFAPELFDLIAQAVAKGYVVMFPEYCGSKGYGAQHYQAVDYTGKDTSEVLASVDYLVKTREFVDPERIGIAGHSHGGLIALSAIQKSPKRFKAAVDMMGLSDLVAYAAYNPPKRMEQQVVREPTFKGKYPYQDLQPYIDASPMNHVDKFETPLLIITTNSDHHVQFEVHARRLAEVLKAHGKTYEYQEYDNAPGGHVFVFGDSEAARQAFEKTFQFLGKYLRP